MTIMTSLIECRTAVVLSTIIRKVFFFKAYYAYYILINENDELLFTLATQVNMQNILFFLVWVCVLYIVSMSQTYANKTIGNVNI